MLHNIKIPIIRIKNERNKNMIMNKKAEFAVKILLEYAKENGINKRDTTDLSPLEEWLILRLYNVVRRSEQYCDCQEIIVADFIDNKHCSQCDKPMDSL